MFFFDAQEVAVEAQEVLRSTIKPDTIVVAPVLPCGPLKLSASPKARELFTRLARHFAAIPALGGCPLLTVPVDVLPDGTPLAVGFFSLHRSDARLLAIAHKMAPLVQQQAAAARAAAAAAATAAAQPTASADAAGRAKGKGSTPQKAGNAGAAAAGAAAVAAGGAGAKGASAAGSAASDKAAAAAEKAAEKALAKAEKFKEQGNEAFKAGKYTDAVAAYTKAIGACGDNYVYYNNRAMACLKVGFAGWIGFCYSLLSGGSSRGIACCSGGALWLLVIMHAPRPAGCSSARGHWPPSSAAPRCPLHLGCPPVSGLPSVRHSNVCCGIQASFNRSTAPLRAAGVPLRAGRGRRAARAVLSRPARGGPRQGAAAAWHRAHGAAQI